ncbi:hypothetical protein [Kitasatospora purpeofusca]|uniref:hypothetical protein n=1 Tax=Kitasatospora purpeofusca TaxID=67352 RepID=UPI002A5AAFD5|nr:hypothetical protein [Kitasatospora purpeofusca]MDY0811979.1 hypothetical protein [Kitasatospora purpeofusca]
MPITDDIKKTLTDPTPLYALAGAGDLAYEKLREVPGRVEALAADRKGTQEKATAALAEAQARLVDAQAKVSGSVTALPTDLKALQEKAQTFALQQVGRAVELAVKAKETYDELAERGKVAVDRGRGADAEVVAGAGEAVAERVDAESAEAGELVEGELVEDEAPVAPKRGRSRKSAE